VRFAAFDVETGGVEREYALQPFRATLAQRMIHGVKQAWLTSYAIAIRKGDKVITDGATWPSTENLRKLLVKFAATKTYVVAWNAPFDAAWLIALGLREEVFAVNWIDGMLLYKHLTSSPKYLPADDTPAPTFYGLKQAVEKFYPDEAGYEEGIDFADESFGAMMKLQEYNQLDCKHTLRLAEQFWEDMTAEQRRVALIEARCIPLIAETMVQGIAVDTGASVILSQKLQDAANLALVTLKVSSGVGEITEKVLASPKQLGELMFDTWGLPVVKETDGGGRATDKEALGELAEMDPRAKLVRDFREAHNNRTKFAEAVILSEAYNGDGCVRPNPRVFGTYTGRLTYSSKQGKGKAERPTGIALHQWKQGKEFRAQLVAPPGFTLIEPDFSGQEFRWMAVESGDQTMLNLCEPGEDAHSFMGARIGHISYRDLMAAVSAGEDWSGPVRKLGKVGNLSLQYRTGYKRLRIVARTQYDVSISEPESKAIWGTYRTTYPGVPKYWNRQIALGKDQGWVENLAGRRVQLGSGEGWTSDRKWSYESTAINFPVQGLGADQKYLALAVLRNYLPTVGGHFYFELHDATFVIVPDEHALRAAHEIKHLLSNLPYKSAWGKEFPIKFPVDVKLGKSWGALKEIE